MSSEIDKMFELSDEDIIEFLEGRGITRECKECGKEAITLATKRNDQYPVLLAASSPPDISTVHFFYYYQLVCLNCGNVRLFERGIAAQWKGEIEGKSDVVSN